MLSLGCRLPANYERRMETEVYTTLVTCKAKLSRVGHFVLEHIYIMPRADGQVPRSQNRNLATTDKSVARDGWGH